MDSKDASVPTPVVKKVFTTASQKYKNEESIKTKMDSSNELKEDQKPIKSKTKKTSKPKQPEAKPSSDEIDAKLITKSSEEKPKKKPRQRKPENSKSVEDQLSKEVKEMTVSSPTLSIEAAPFIPGKSLLPLNPTASSSPKPVRKPVSRPKPKTDKDGDLRSVEVKQLQIRFSPTGFFMTKIAEDDSINLQCVMPIIDPDFAYDLESVRIEIILPRGYPGTKSIPTRPTFSILNSDIPSPIIGRIERNLKWGLNSLEGGILVCRPMLRYLEDNLEKWMVDDVRESVFKFVKPSEIKVTQKEIVSEDESEVESEDEYDQIFNVSNTPNFTPNPSTTQSRYSKGDWIAPPPITDQSSVGGTPYTLKLLFTTIRNIDLLSSQKLIFLASCDRCKFNFPVEDLRPFIDRIEHCPKCTSQTKFYYKSQLITPGGNIEDESDDNEYEGTLGTIRFLRAKPVDLLPSLYQCACNRCFGSEAPDDLSGSSCKIEKVKIGENVNYSCFNCHQKIRFQIDRVEWINDSPSSSTNSTKTKCKTPTGPTLTVGNPLPNNGACEHYKKSFRWYRFPCCGQAFPCDECHSKDPVAKSHPVEWANKFICGFCSREQSIHIKECPECGKNTSASGRKFTSFWEGGKGLRNQILMSKKDSKKYKDYGTTTKSILKKKKSE